MRASGYKLGHDRVVPLMDSQKLRCIVDRFITIPFGSIAEEKRNGH